MELELHLEQQLFSLHDRLIDGSYTHEPYTDFYVCDPKRRHIHKATACDRVLHQAVFRVLYRIFDRYFIYDSYSSRVNKGTHIGVHRLQTVIRKETNNWKHTKYVLKCDIRKFFDSIDHNILMKLLQRRITDPRVIHLLQIFFDSFHTTPARTSPPLLNQEVINTTGIPLGNVTSQLFANIYMNELDQYVKHILKRKNYFRYCDDFVILGDSVLDLLVVLDNVKKFLITELSLQLHPNKIEIRKTSQGIDFLGYVILPYVIIIRPKTRQRIIRKVTQARSDFDNGVISCEKFEATIQSYLGVVSHSSDRKLERYLKQFVSGE